MTSPSFLRGIDISRSSVDIFASICMLIGLFLNWKRVDNSLGDLSVFSWTLNMQQMWISDLMSLFPVCLSNDVLPPVFNFLTFDFFETCELKVRVVWQSQKPARSKPHLYLIGNRHFRRNVPERLKSDANMWKEEKEEVEGQGGEKSWIMDQESQILK